jgi:WD40 repeat protein
MTSAPELSAPELSAAAIPNRDPAEVVIRPPFNPRCVAFSPDGTLLAIGSSDVVELTDAPDGTVLRVLRGHIDTVNAVAFSPDGTLIATASSDGTTRTWYTATGQHLATLVALPDGGYATLLPDGRYKLEGDPTDRVWWAIKLCRFEPGELDPYVPHIKRLPPDARILPRS